MKLYSLHSEMDNVNIKDGINMVEKAQETDTINLENKSVVTSPVSPAAPNQTNNNAGRVHTRKEQRSGNTLYQEISFQVSQPYFYDCFSYNLHNFPYFVRMQML